ncbi:MAG: peptide deformylase [Flammeovirgaceae bacterium]|nr:peptide deformylase [Flammeovirgaceae bacterium]MBE61040.1 peptide deformylase [Flammeovirgaceae bacterium]MBR08379.1 peptide deformylase [Rickettsiales bacterium]HCX21085.1 peptide deformylase [Cytophagales bacterium]|tara:strand:- start:350 stop:898 length:549 start_codon:yes stop_codon:yes gene_type:complete
MIYPIVLFGDPVLKKKASDIPHGEDVKELVQDMFDTMYAASGVGLAAPQIGKSIRLFVVDDNPMMEEGEQGMKKAFINPEIIEEDGDDWAFEEGCLSIPGIRADVERPEIVKIKYFDEDWNEHIEEYDDIHARVIQHEYDHIDGILFTDYLTPFKKRMLKGKLTNISKGKVDADYRVKAPKK